VTEPFESRPFETFVEPRGMLLPIDLGDVPFDASRLFVVVGPPEGATRGGHVVPCQELLVLVSGAVEVRYGGVTTRLTEPGGTVLLSPGGLVEYDLAPGGSTLLVLADAPYAVEP
jgi:hypothetical protein